jgi:hypothetical protein
MDNPSQTSPKLLKLMYELAASRAGKSEQSLCEWHDLVFAPEEPHMDEAGIALQKLIPSQRTVHGAQAVVVVITRSLKL